MSNNRWQYLAGLVLVAMVSLLCRLSYAWISPDNWTLFYLVSVIMAALYWGEGPAVLVAFLSFLMLDFGVGTPLFQFNPIDAQYLISLGTFIFVGLIISNLSNRVRRQAFEARRRERHTAALYAFTRSLAREPDRGLIATSFAEHGSRACGVEVQLLLGADEAPESERDLYERCLAEGQPVLNYFPLLTPRGPRGAARLRGVVPPPEQPLLTALCSQAALALEHVETRAQARRAEVLAETERLQTALLNSLSHDLHTPLASISGSLQVLRDSTLSLDPATQSQMLELAHQQTERLKRLVSNLLEITRLDGGALRLNLEPCDPADLLGSTIASLAEPERVSVTIDPELEEVPVDFVLMSQVLGNLLENALKYSPEGAPIEVCALTVGDEVEISVQDEGLGIPAGDLERVFERFFRVERPLKVPGSGLGLSICRAIVETHGGRIWAENRSGAQGTRMVVRIPSSLAKEA